jgi:hypothetical protein
MAVELQEEEEEGHNIEFRLIIGDDMFPVKRELLTTSE